jgi:hypothetical protein
MTRRPTTRRRAATLLEVLLGMGIMGVAVTSIITLFPFSALTIAKALKDDRGTTAAVSADGLLRDVHKRLVVEVGPGATEPYFTAMDNGPGVAGANPVPTTAQTVSYPVLLDPMGIAAGRGLLGDTGQAMIPRVTLSFITTNTTALRIASQLDGLTYTSDGVIPTPTPAGMRELRYNVAWMLQRPSNADRYTVRQQVLVFDRRAHLYAPPGSEAVYAGVTMVPGTTSISGIPNTAELRKGSWVLDAGNPLGLAASGQPPLLQAEFYRVISVTDTGTTYTLEVHKPIVRSDGQTASYSANLVVMPALADVFERPMLTAGTGP